MAVQTRLGKYEVLGEIGRGAMGVVYRAYDTTLERHVALKTMQLGDGSKAGENTVRFLREARSAGGLRHPNIVTIYELGEDQGVPFIAMELMEGVDLERVLESGRHLDLSRRLDIVAQVCDGLHFAHEAGIVHRDVKPANVFLSRDGQVKILDFGIAKLAASDATKTGTIIGTVDYMSPEQIRADKQLDGRSDQFSAGVILYQLLFGTKPFEGEHLAATMYRIVHLPPDGFADFQEVLPAPLARVMKKVLAKDPRERFTDCRALSVELRRIAGELTGVRGSAVSDTIARSLERGALRRIDSAGPAPESDPTIRVDSIERAESSPDTEGHLPRPRWMPSRQAFIASGFLLAVILIVSAFVFRQEKQPQGPGPTFEKQAPERAQAAPSKAEETMVVESVAESQPPESATEQAMRQQIVPEQVPEDEPRSNEMARIAASRSPAVVPRSPGRIGIATTPTARIESIEDLDSGEMIPTRARTPTVLELPEGRYLVTLRATASSEPLLVQAKVRADRLTRIFKRMPGFDQSAWTSRFIKKVESDRARNSKEK